MIYHASFVLLPSSLVSKLFRFPNSSSKKFQTFKSFQTFSPGFQTFQSFQTFLSKFPRFPNFKKFPNFCHFFAIFCHFFGKFPKFTIFHFLTKKFPNFLGMVILGESFQLKFPNFLEWQVSKPKSFQTFDIKSFQTSIVSLTNCDGCFFWKQRTCLHASHRPHTRSTLFSCF